MPSRLYPSESVDSTSSSIVSLDTPPPPRRKKPSSGHRGHTSDSEQRAENIHTATREELKEYKNDAFLDVVSAYKDTIRKLKERDELLKEANQQNTVLRTSNDKLSLAIAEMATQHRAAPAQHAPLAASSVFSVMLSKSDCPTGIKYWDEASFTAHLKAGGDILDPSRSDSRSKEKIPAAMEYLEKDDGTTVSAEELKAIRALSRRLVHDMEKGLRGMTRPGTWRKAGTLEVEHFYGGIYAVYPYLRWCHDHWKVRYLASETMSGSTNAQNKRQKRHGEKAVKQEGATQGITIAPSSPVPSSPLPPGPSSPARLSRALSSPLPSVPSSPIPSSKKHHRKRDRPTHDTASDLRPAKRSKKLTVKANTSQNDSTRNAADFGAIDKVSVATGKTKAQTNTVSAAPRTLPATAATQQQGSPPVPSRAASPAPAPHAEHAEIQDSHLTAAFGAPIAPAGRRDAFNAPSAAPSAKAPAVKSKMRRATRGHDPMNLYYLVYKQKHGPASEADFAKIWEDLPVATRKIYEDQSADLKTKAKKKGKASAEGA